MASNKVRGPGEQLSSKQRIDEPDDVEGHALKQRGPEELNRQRDAEGMSPKRRLDDEDVEGHALKQRGPEELNRQRDAEGMSPKRRVDEDDDVEGHQLHTRTSGE